jgi:hypothetical protein
VQLLTRAILGNIRIIWADQAVQRSLINFWHTVAAANRVWTEGWLRLGDVGSLIVALKAVGLRTMLGWALKVRIEDGGQRSLTVGILVFGKHCIHGEIIKTLPKVCGTSV